MEDQKVRYRFLCDRQQKSFPVSVQMVEAERVPGDRKRDDDTMLRFDGLEKMEKTLENHQDNRNHKDSF